MYGALLLALAIAGAAGSAAAQEVQHFRAWTAVCDNLKTCSAYGYTDEGADNDAFIRLARTAGPDAAPAITIGVSGGEDDAARIAWRISVDGAAPTGLEATRTRAADGGRRAVLSPTQSRALAEALRNGASMKLQGGKATAQIGLSGSSAALRWIDDRQGRVGTVTALVARGSKPAAAVPAAPLPPVIRAAPAAPQDLLPDKLPAALGTSPILKDCDAEAMGEPPTVARLAPGLILWGAPCSAGAYNLVSVLILADEAGRGAREITPPDAQAADPNADNELMNINYDPATRTLTSFAKARAIGDCGAAATWVWDGKAFQLLDEAVMPDCQGVGADDWPSLYHAVRAR
jgi:hypothetical protein